MRYFLEIAYKGTLFHGFQKQDGVPTVQGEINFILKKLLGHDIVSVGSGRTDAGVHCLKQFMHFDTPKEIKDRANFIYRMNRILHHDILVRDIFVVRDELSARFSASSRSYEYHVTRRKNPFLSDFAYFYPMPHLEIGRMNEAVPILYDYNDFEAFSKVQTEVAHFLCHIKKAEWKEVGKEQLVFYITADRFLRGMVRAIVGTLLEVGRGRLSKEEFRNIIQSKDRRNAGRAVPPQGLFLTDVSYPSSIFI